MIRGDDKVEIYHDEKDGLDWLKFTCAIWVKYNYKQVKKLLKSKDGHKKISVEVEVNDYEFDENGIEIIKDFTFDGVTILGDNLETGIADANLTILDMIDNALFQKKQKCLCYAYDTLNKNETSENQGENLDNQNSDKEAFSSDTVPNEGVEEIEMNQENQEGGKQKMLTYENKRSLLESYLCENLKREGNDCDCTCWAWVCDLDDAHVYFEFDGKYYRAAYSIVESEDEGNSVNVDIEGKEQVVRSWSTFEAESDPVVEEPTQPETFEEDPKEEEPKDEPKEQHEEDPDNEEDDKDDKDDDKGDKDDDGDGDFAATEPVVENPQETFADPNEPIDLNEEPADVNTETPTTEEIIEESTASIVAPEVQTEVDNLGDANGQAAEVLGDGVTEVIADANINDISLQVSEGPDGQPATVVDGEDEGTSQVQQPDDNDKEKMFEVVTIELNGENLDINSLLEKYNSLKDEYDALNQTVKLQNAKALAKFGADFINADSDVDEDSKNTYIAQVTEKCESFEFTSEDEVVKFAKGLLAMYYYENRVSKKGTSDFSISIEQPVHVDKPASGSKLKEAINKLNHI